MRIKNWLNYFIHWVHHNIMIKNKIKCGIFHFSKNNGYCELSRKNKHTRGILGVGERAIFKYMNVWERKVPKTKTRETLKPFVLFSLYFSRFAILLFSFLHGCLAYSSSPLHGNDSIHVCVFFFLFVPSRAAFISLQSSITMPNLDPIESTSSGTSFFIFLLISMYWGCFVLCVCFFLGFWFY